MPDPSLSRSSAPAPASASHLRASVSVEMLLETANAMIVQLNRAGQITLFNRAGTLITGYTEAELLGREWFDVLVPRERYPEVWRAFTRIAEGDLPREFENPVLTKSGEERTIAWRNSVLREHGRVSGLLAVGVDITAQRRMDAQWRESEARFRSAVETAPDAIFIQTHGHFAYVNDAAVALFGASNAADLVGTPVPERFAPEVRAQVVNRIRRLNQERKAVPLVEEPCLRLDGTCLVAEISAVPFTFQGEAGALVFARDVTARKQAEAALRLSEARLHFVLERSHIGGWELNLSDHSAQRTLEHDRIFGYEALLPEWTYEQFLAHVLPEDRADVDRRFQQAVAMQQDWNFECRIRRCDGQVRWIWATGGHLRDADGQVRRLSGIVQDITERHLLELQSRQSQRMEAIGTLAGGIAHDLNNILAPLLMLSDLLRPKLQDEEDQEMLTLMHSSAQRGADIIKQLLTFSRGMEGRRLDVQPRHILREMLAMMRETFPREIDLQEQVSADLWPVRADPTQLHQVVLNLCVNARDAMPTGGHLTLGATNLELTRGQPAFPASAAPGRYVRIEVSDSGHGIPADVQDRIFDPFFTTKPLGQGTGLGLSTVLGIVQNHGGFVTVESEQDRGSTFRVYLPALSAERAPAAAAATDAPAAPLPPRAEGELILVVDDERSIRDATRRVLEAQGYRVRVAIHGEDARAQYLAARTSVRLVLTDLMMPVMNGLALIQALREFDPQLPIVATTGLGDVDKRRELAALGVNAVLLKPCDNTLLLEAIRAQLAPPGPAARS